jgi:hypothetical protein
VLGLLLVLPTCELLARAWFRWGVGNYVWKPHFRLKLEHDRQHLPLLSPRTAFTVNSQGVRGDEPRKDGRGYRVLACGGSAVECIALDDRETWPAILQEILNDPSNLSRLDVDWAQAMNIGRSGMTVDMLGYSLARVLPRLGRFDAVVIMIGASAVNSWTSQGAPPTAPNALPPWTGLSWHNRHQFGWRPHELALAEVPRRLCQWLAPPRTLVRSSGFGLIAARHERAQAQVLRDRFGDPSPWLAHFEDLLVEAIRIAHGFAKHVLVIRQPHFSVPRPSAEEQAMLWHGFVDERVRPRRVFYTHRAICEMMRLVDGATERACLRSGAEMLAASEFIQPTSKNFYDHFHLTPAGARLLGEHLAERILFIARGPHAQMGSRFASRSAMQEELAVAKAPPGL